MQNRQWRVLGTAVVSLRGEYCNINATAIFEAGARWRGLCGKLIAALGLLNSPLQKKGEMSISARWTSVESY